MRRKVRKIIVPLFAFGVILSVAVLGSVAFFSAKMPDSFYSADSALNLNSDYPISAHRAESLSAVNSNPKGSYQAVLKIFGVIPVKKIQVVAVDATDVILLGESFGIKIFTKGVVISDIQPVDTSGGNVDAGREAGLKKGDIILCINGEEINTSEQAAAIISSCGGESIKILAKRGEKTFDAVLNPQYSASEKTYKAGLWVKDSSAGIGTLTFYSPSHNVVAGLGHGVIDPDISTLLPLGFGEMVPAEIFSVAKSRNGSPGELKGRFKSGIIGSIYANDETGVFAEPNEPLMGQSVSLALKQEVEIGAAQIITTLDSSGAQSFDCKISKINYNSGEKTKNMLITVTDPRLLEATGGIVQGMSGSPVIQNGKLVGAVTHVLVDDPTRGYAIFAENMLETAQSVAEEKLEEAS